MSDHSPHSRPDHLKKSHALLLRANSILSTLSPASSSATAVTHYHLALSYAQPGDSHDLELALEYAGKAVEHSSDVKNGSDTDKIRHWHLLGLILSMLERWDAATEVFETALALASPEELQSDGEGMPEDASMIPDDADRIIDGLPNGRSPLQDERPLFLVAPSVGVLAAFNSLNPLAEVFVPQSAPSSALASALNVLGAYLPISISAAPQNPAPVVHTPWYIPPSTFSAYLHSILQLRMTFIAFVEKSKGGEGAAEEVRVAFEAAGAFLHDEEGLCRLLPDFRVLG